MSAARVLLAEAERYGVRLYRQGDRIRWRAPQPPPADLLERLRRHREALRAVVPEAPAAVPPAPVAPRPGFPDGLIPIEEPPEEPDRHVTYAFKVEVIAFDPPPPPVELRPGVVVRDVRLAAWGMLGDLLAEAEVYGETCGDGGDDRRLRLATEAGQEIERLIENLAKLGVRVRVVGVQ